MNICFAYITPFHPERGGIGRVTHVLTQEFQKRGHSIYYLIYPCAITIRHEFDYPAPLTYLPSSETLSVENIEAYKQYLRNNKIDIVINQSGNFSDSLLWVKCRELDIPIISVLHANPWVSYTHFWHANIIPLKNDCALEKIKRIARILLYPKLKLQLRQHRINHFKTILPLTDKVCMLSKNYYSELDEIYPGFKSKYLAIQNPNSYSESQTHRISPKKKQIIFIGLFGAQKKEILILKIWKRIYRDFPEWNLVIIGDGPIVRKNKLLNTAKKLDRVSFTGFVNPLNYQLESSILCMTSMYEGWPMVLTESMQCGVVPILFNSFAAAREIVKNNETGMLIKPFSLAEYEIKLRELMSNDSLREKMSDAARLSIKRFDIKKIADKWEKAINEIVSMYPSGSLNQSKS